MIVHYQQTAIYRQIENTDKIYKNSNDNIQQIALNYDPPKLWSSNKAKE